MRIKREKDEKRDEEETETCVKRVCDVFVVVLVCCCCGCGWVTNYSKRIIIVRGARAKKMFRQFSSVKCGLLFHVQ